jgi:hypothetical protein
VKPLEGWGARAGWVWVLSYRISFVCSTPLPSALFSSLWSSTLPSSTTRYHAQAGSSTLTSLRSAPLHSTPLHSTLLWFRATVHHPSLSHSPLTAVTLLSSLLFPSFLLSSTSSTAPSSTLYSILLFPPLSYTR